MKENNDMDLFLKNYDILYTDIKKTEHKYKLHRRRFFYNIMIVLMNIWSIVWLIQNPNYSFAILLFGLATFIGFTIAVMSVGDFMVWREGKKLYKDGIEKLKMLEGMFASLGMNREGILRAIQQRVKYE